MAEKPKPIKISLTCNECGKKFKVGVRTYDPSCPKCGGCDYEVM